ncbi:UDP-N-acetylmuramoyl-L-alanyl-D-glutamate--2,6-diaminopimelate ligase, partial [Streptomyces sp. DJ]
MRTITDETSGDDPRRPLFRPGRGAAGTLTAVPKADQPTSRQDAPARPPGAPRPDRVRPKPLAELARRLGTPVPAGAADDAAATGITHDSRAVRPGDVYAALPGARFHGADFAVQAAGNGAVAVLTDKAG